MKEFETALERARAKLSNGEPTAPGAPADPSGEPVVLGAPMARRDGGEPAAAAPLPPSAGTGRRGAALAEAPVLQADFAHFRENFGGTAGDTRGVDGAFRMLRTRVLDTLRLSGGRILGVTSPSAGAGKTVTSIHLALACARRPEQTVTLADFDLRRPSVARYLSATGFTSSIGFFRGEEDIHPYLSRSEGGNLGFFLTDRSTEMSAEFLASHRMDTALRQFTQLGPAPIVIADLPPLSGCDDALAMMPKLDGIILVVAAGETSFDAVEQAIGMIPPEKLVTTVLNKSKRNNVYYEYY